MPDECKLVAAPRQVIANKLLAALDDEDRVAILATRDDLDLLMTALEYASLEIGTEQDGAKFRRWFEDLGQLRRAAFGEN